jgi:hypothetical protein
VVRGVPDTPMVFAFPMLVLRPLRCRACLEEARVALSTVIALYRQAVYRTVIRASDRTRPSAPGDVARRG